MTNKNLTTASNEEQKAIVDANNLLAAKSKIYIAIGQHQVFKANKEQSIVGEILTYKTVKESNEYKGIPYVDENGVEKTTSNLKDICKYFFNCSYSTMEERLSNLESFGEDFLNASQKIGLGIREMRALKSLPTDEQALIIESEAVEVGDKESIKDLIDDLKAKHKKELDNEKKKTKDADEQRQVAVRMRDDYQMKAMDYQTELESTKFKADAWVDQTKHLLFEATKYESNAVESLSRLIALREHFLDDDNLSPQVTEYLAAGLLHSFKTLAEDFAQAWLETSNILEGYLPKMRPSLDVLQELNDSAMSNEE
ncbi:hypothetical protein [Pseudoalteromonas sp. NZS100]|uniref:hypothetical protein n=1 Tax=Pseudoalteromonas sp. NZS100 TaxID=2792046 RepID=UPI0018CFEA10|nr:hypothetical protein [Pseudoalteromonas sp. NZS100]MBH0066767.1 hypothetical protein [Pseudoalteromonas sp. NZS100]